MKNLHWDVFFKIGQINGLLMMGDIVHAKLRLRELEKLLMAAVITAAPRVETDADTIALTEK